MSPNAGEKGQKGPWRGKAAGKRPFRRRSNALSLLERPERFVPVLTRFNKYTTPLLFYLLQLCRK